MLNTIRHRLRNLGGGPGLADLSSFSRAPFLVDESVYDCIVGYHIAGRGRHGRRMLRMTSERDESLTFIASAA